MHRNAGRSNWKLIQIHFQCGVLQERERREQNGGGLEARELRHDPPWDRQGPGRRLILAGEGSGLRKQWRMDGTKKGAPTGVDRDIGVIEGGDRGANGKGKRRKKWYAEWGCRG